MSTITAILQAQPDGTVHVPVPEELRNSKIKLVATLEPVESSELVPPSAPARRKAGSLKGKIWMAPDFDEPLEDFKEYME